MKWTLSHSLAKAWLLVVKSFTGAINGPALLQPWIPFTTPWWEQRGHDRCSTTQYFPYVLSFTTPNHCWDPLTQITQLWLHRHEEINCRVSCTSTTVDPYQFFRVAKFDQVFFEQNWWAQSIKIADFCGPCDSHKSRRFYSITFYSCTEHSSCIVFTLPKSCAHKATHCQRDLNMKMKSQFCVDLQTASKNVKFVFLCCVVKTFIKFVTDTPHLNLAGLFNCLPGITSICATEDLPHPVSQLGLDRLWCSELLDLGVEGPWCNWKCGPCSLPYTHQEASNQLLAHTNQAWYYELVLPPTE